MRNKLREMKNREEGFTLVELLAVIVILGIILAIAIPSIGGIINRSQANADEAEDRLVIEAARVYVVAEYNDLDFDNDTETVDASDLVTWGYLEERGDTALTGTVTISRNTTDFTDDRPDADSFTYTYGSITE